jgi:cystathionine beta-lyase
MEFPDLPALVAIARDRGVLTALDNTWGAGVALKGFDLGIDIVMQALTKYPSGGGDVLMGSVVTRDVALHEKLKFTHMRLGVGISANDAELVLRSLSSIGLRYAAQDVAARELAHWLSSRQEVRAVLHPALAGSPGHENWRQVCSAAAGLFSVVFHGRYSQLQVDAFVDGLKLFRIGYSWAGPMSLVVPYELSAIRGTETLQRDYLQGRLVRLSIGLEGVADLKADLSQSMAAALG